jgi:hypothetical protein
MYLAALSAGWEAARGRFNGAVPSAGSAFCSAWQHGRRSL